MLRSPSDPVTEDGEAPPLVAKEDDLHEESHGDSKSDRLLNLYIKALSWPAEGRGLLHVLSPLLHSKDFKIRGASGSYFLSRDELQLGISRSKSETGQNIIVHLDVANDGIFLDASECHCGNSPSEMWEEIPRDPTGLLISIGNVLRFGSYKIRVVDVVLSVDSDPSNLGSLKPFPVTDLTDTASENTIARSEAHSTGGPVCRICFEAGDDVANALLSPCSCSGSLRYIHVGCLRRWLDGQLQVKELDEGGGSYLIRTITCEICKSVYSKSVYESVLIPRPKVPHIILEDFVVPDAHLSPRSGLASVPTSKIHIIPMMTGKPVRIGRSKESEIVLSDISVSRTHAVLNFSEKGVRLVDLNSKFGTLVQLPSRIFHPVGSSALRVQIGSSLVEITASHPSRIERILPERFFQERGVVKVVKSKSPNERIIEAERLRRSGSPTSPAATLNNSGVMSPGLLRDEVIDPPE